MIFRPLRRQCDRFRGQSGFIIGTGRGEADRYHLCGRPGGPEPVRHLVSASGGRATVRPPLQDLAERTGGACRRAFFPGDFSARAAVWSAVLPESGACRGDYRDCGRPGELPAPDRLFSGREFSLCRGDDCPLAAGRAAAAGDSKRLRLLPHPRHDARCLHHSRIRRGAPARLAAPPRDNRCGACRSAGGAKRPGGGAGGFSRQRQPAARHRRDAGGGL